MYTCHVQLTVLHYARNKWQDLEVQYRVIAYRITGMSDVVNARRIPNLKEINGKGFVAKLAKFHSHYTALVYIEYDDNVPVNN